jgi:hypothetical protein
VKRIVFEAVVPRFSARVVEGKGGSCWPKFVIGRSDDCSAWVIVVASAVVAGHGPTVRRLEGADRRPGRSRSGGGGGLLVKGGSDLDPWLDRFGQNWDVA